MIRLQPVDSADAQLVLDAWGRYAENFSYPAQGGRPFHNYSCVKIPVGERRTS